MKKVYFVRHGESEHNRADLMGSVSAPLTELGRQQAVDAARELMKLEGAAVSSIVASPLPRARQTAEIIADELGFPLRQIEWDYRLREVEVGALETIPKTPKNRERVLGYFMTKDNKFDVEYIGDLVARLESFFADLSKRPDEVMLLVGHGMSGRMLRRVVGKQEPTKPMQRLKNAQVIQLYPYTEPGLFAEKSL